ncbi:hypothetical protein [Nitrosopumilus spindle-shaped virus]|uniref:Uncharacterized protein n=1 Tax=Nitrosopumilus spindle-shaped virus TaxID=2508184 RepID=A0A514K345_9VIRU|nr:hypothetical protein [Nitrosopumilus spindle-shaped virus]
MGGLYKITFRGKDKIIGTEDDYTTTLYLDSSAYNWYVSNTDNELVKLKNIDDSVIAIFHLQNATTNGISATREELREYARTVLGMTDADAENFVNRNSGISKDQMIELNDQFQKDIIEQRAKEISQAEELYQETINVRDPNTTFEDAKQISQTFEENLEMIFDQTDPIVGVEDPSSLTKTSTDYAREKYLEIDETLTDPLSGDKTREIPKEDQIVTFEGTKEELTYKNQTTPTPEIQDPTFLDKYGGQLVGSVIVGLVTAVIIYGVKKGTKKV